MLIHDPSSLAYHIARSVPYDRLFDCYPAPALLLIRGPAVMVVRLEPHADAEVMVQDRPGAEWRRTTANETDTIARMWP